MQERKVILTWEAIYDVAEIAEYIEKNFGSARADVFEENIKMQMQDIGYLGGAFGNTHIYYHSYSIFMKPFPPSIIHDNRSLAKRGFYCVLCDKRAGM